MDCIFDKEIDWNLHDAHCHVTDIMSSIPAISSMKARTLVVMSTRAEDQKLVEEIAQDELSNKVIPSFGWHPWFAHHIIIDDSNTISSLLSPEEKMKHYQSVLTPPPEDLSFVQSLPDPLPLSKLIAQTEARLSKHPLALVGEIGLDKIFRLPSAWRSEENKLRDDSLTPGGREGRDLSPYSVSMRHQQKVLLAQLRLAGRRRRAVSVHGVQAHGFLYDTFQIVWDGHTRPSKRQLKREEEEARRESTAPHIAAESARLQSAPKPYPPRVCLHSYSGPVEAAKRYLDPTIPSTVFFSFSIAVNFSSRVQKKTSQTEQVIKMLPADKILIESDLHFAGQEMDDNLEAITRKICELKRWNLDEGVKQLSQNWRMFVFGHKESD